MKGVILAGGSGTRLRPFSRYLNKHLLNIYNSPMVFYPIRTLIRSSVDDIMIVAGGEHGEMLLKAIGNGKDLGARSIHYTFQYKPTGIAGALRLTEDFVGKDNCMVVLGDNVTNQAFNQEVEHFDKVGKGAHVFLKEVHDPKRYGIAEVDGVHVIGLEEKPKVPKSNLCVTGIYLYDNTLWDYLKTLVPSHRGELEITDVNKEYMKKRLLEWSPIRGFWIDAGEVDALLTASVFMASHREDI